MLIDCDTCTVRGQGCDDCVVTVLLGAPPGWHCSDPKVVPLTRRAAEPAPPERRGAPAVAGTGVEDAAPAPSAADSPGSLPVERDVRRIDTIAGAARPVVELDDVEHRAVRALADFGLVPPLLHQDASTPGDRHVS